MHLAIVQHPRGTGLIASRLPEHKLLVSSKMT